MTMRSRIAFVLGIVLCAVWAAGPARAANVKALSPVKGVLVWLAEDHTVPIVSMTATLPAGSAYDPATKSGLAAMAAALLEEGAGRFDAGAFHSALDDHDVLLSVEPDRDRLAVTLKVLPSDAKAAFRMLGVALSKPRFEYDAITRVRLSMMQGIDQNREDPAAVAWNAFHSFYFGPHSYGHPVEGAKGGLISITREDLQGFVKAHWARGAINVAIAGDVTPAQAADLARAAFAALPLRPAPAPIPTPFMVGAAGVHVLAMDVPQPDAIFALPGVKRNDPDFMAALVANTILGGAENARLTRELREKRGLTYDVSTDLTTYASAGIVTGEIQAEKKDMRAALNVVRETLRQFALEGPTRQEFNDARSYLAGSFALGFTSNEDIARQLASFMDDGLPPDYVRRHGGLIWAVRFEDVRRVARRLYASDRLTVVVAGSLPKAKRSSNPFRE